MLLRLVLLSLVPVALAQQNATYVAGLLQTLRGLGANTVASGTEELNRTSIGQNLSNVLLDGRTNLTVFVPNDGACEYTLRYLADSWLDFSIVVVTGLQPSIFGDSRQVADIISYHVVAGNFSNQVATFPNVTVGRTYLSDPIYVALEGNKSQVLVWSRFNDSRVHILNQEYASCF